MPLQRKVDKVKKAMDTFKKLQMARNKASDAEHMLEQLRRAVSMPGARLLACVAGMDWSRHGLACRIGRGSLATCAHA